MYNRTTNLNFVVFYIGPPRKEQPRIKLQDINKHLQEYLDVIECKYRMFSQLTITLWIDFYKIGIQK